jgi:hypothetical protein
MYLEMEWFWYLNFRVLDVHCIELSWLSIPEIGQHPEARPSINIGKDNITFKCLFFDDNCLSLSQSGTSK